MGGPPSQLAWLLVLAAQVVSSTADLANAWQITAQTKGDAAMQSKVFGIAGSNSQGGGNQDILNLWFKSFMTTYNKKYPNPTAQQVAMRNFQATLMKVMKVNTNMSVPFIASANRFADINYQDFSQKVLMKVNPMRGRVPSRRRRLLAEQAAALTPDALTPDFGLDASAPRVRRSKDWRSLGAVTPIRDQWYCGSCWAFAATAAIESAYHIYYRIDARKKPIDLSEQQIVSCGNENYYNAGCDGGYSEGAINYAGRFGLSTELLYPYSTDAMYSGITDNCTKKLQPASNYAKLAISSANYGAYVSETEMMTRVDQQPQVIYFHQSRFQRD